MISRKLLVPFVLISVFTPVLNKAAQYNFHSDVIVTKWPTPKTPVEAEPVKQDEDQKGFVRRQLVKFGEVASKIGNVMGSHASKIAQAIDRICEVVKTIIPLLAAVCHVGQFKFCAAATEGPGELSAALNPSSLDLDSLDK